MGIRGGAGAFAPANNSFGHLREWMALIFEKSAQVDLRSFELAQLEVIERDLRPIVLALIQEAKRALMEVANECERMVRGDTPPSATTDDDIRNSFLPFERALDATVASKSGSILAIEEVAFVAQLELGQQETRLSRLKPAQGSSSLISEIDSGLRRTRKALAAVEVTIANTWGTPPYLDFRSELQVSLAVRRAYAKFRSGLQLESAPTEDDLRARFRAAGTQIAMFVGRDVYPELRVRDRLLLRNLQQRILSWLRQPTENAAREGMRLWQDLVGCVEMFSLVNRRAELVEHDTKMIATSLAKLRREDATVDTETQHALSALAGLDHDLDKLLDAPTWPSPRDFLACLERLAPLYTTPDTGLSAPW